MLNINTKHEREQESFKMHTMSLRPKKV